jgi:RimJ/RimL family protein N-acetyltransferase
LAVHQSWTDRAWSAGRKREWRRGLPELSDGTVVLRELRSHDAPSLLHHLNHSRVLQYIASCPSSVEGFRRFIRWTHAERRRGLHACYGIIPPGQTTPAGIIQIWPIERDFSTAEWGFALGESYWGTGLFTRSARLLLDAVFGPFGVFRLETRAVDANGRGNAVLRKLGATREGVLRGGFRDGDVVSDHVMWSMLAPDWLAIRSRARTAN